MCVIAVYEEVRPTLEDLNKMHTSNKDGAGIAWFEESKVHWKKGLTPKQIFTLSESAPFPFVVHFRLGTVGVGKQLCHPFPITEKGGGPLLEGCSDHVLFHNGHWSQWKDWLIRSYLGSRGTIPDVVWSDSRALAILAYRHGLSLLQFVDHEKIVVMGKDKIRCYGHWIKEKGVRYSNLIWRAYTGNRVVTVGRGTTESGFFSGQWGSQYPSVDENYED